MKTYRSNSLSETEQAELLRTCTSVEDVALFSLALTTGIRRGDIVKIEHVNVDLDNRTIKFWEAKKSRFWTVPLTKDTVFHLQRYINTKKKNGRYLFPFCSKTAYNKLQRSLTHAGIKKEISFHDLRRSFMKTAKRKGLDLKAVSQITGDTYAVIERYYQNLDIDELKEEVDKL